MWIHALQSYDILSEYVSQAVYNPSDLSEFSELLTMELMFKGRDQVACSNGVPRTWKPERTVLEHYTKTAEPR